ncbi:MAG: phosphonate ABC transporter ATP-binding protein [Verrucomicrobiota bacterium]
MLEVNNLTKTVKNGKSILNGITFRVEAGEFVGVLGPSGAGKSLSIRCVLGLTKASSGDIYFEDNKDRIYHLTQLSGKKLRYARMKMGVIFQGSNLVRRLTVLENVMLGRLARIPAWRSWLYGFTDAEARRAMKALNQIGMGEYAGRLTGSLSGGEMQRVAIARAINQNPALYIADEPVSSLDPKNARSIMRLLAPLAAEKGVLGVFHQPDLVAKYCTRMIGLRNGKVIYDGVPSSDSDLLREIYGEELDELADISSLSLHEDDPLSQQIKA